MAASRSTYTPLEDETLMMLSNTTVAAMARGVGRRKKSVVARLAVLQRAQGGSHPRRCLRCNKPFMATDPIRNRICGPCAGINAGAVELAGDTVGSCGGAWVSASADRPRVRLSVTF
jgi:hypothetical protein